MAGINFGSYGKSGTYEEFASKMVSNLVRFIREEDSDRIKKNNIEPLEYYTSAESNMKIKICPEPINFLKKITKEDTTTKRQDVFSNILKEVDTNLMDKPKTDIWFNKSSNGINIRLGNINGDTGNQEPATLGDDCVHGVVVGRTGAGKSVLINNVILNLTTEYAPWELDLFLVDMKKVELSRYMATDENGRYISPHVSACGATSEVRYVVSMIQYLCDCMKARQSLFAALGVQKIKDFREKYSKEFGVDIVLPRILLLVDEFQQMFLEASGKERKILDECITAITKLGRATGVHLLFASQEMSGTLGSKELANFKLRIALPCDAMISEQILGNAAASSSDEKGTTFVNNKGGSKKEDNIIYKTPFIDDKEAEDGSPSEFQRYLSSINNVAIESKFEKVQKFYQEDTQEKIEKIETIKNSQSVIDQISSYLDNNKALVDAFILGSGVLYTNKTNDYVSFFLEKGKKRNIGILCAKDADIGNTLKTLATNFKYSKNVYNHIVVFESEIIRSVYPELVEDLINTKGTAKEINYHDLMQNLNKDVNKILVRLDYTKNCKDVILDFFYKFLGKLNKKELDELVNPEDKKYFNDKTFLMDIGELFCNLEVVSDKSTIQDIRDYLKSLLEKIMNDSEKYKVKTEENRKLADEEKLKSKKALLMVLLLILVKFDSTSKRRVDSYVQSIDIIKKSLAEGKYKGNTNIVWLVGTDNLDKNQDKILSDIMEVSTNYNEIYILAGSNSENLENSYRCCNYMFLNSSDEKLYLKYKMSYTKKSDDNKTMDFKIINYNQERAYKQLSFECEVNDAPKLDFEGIEV